MTEKPCIRAIVDPGICGFQCEIEACSEKKRVVRLKISESECEYLQRLNEFLDEISLKELLMPISRNPVFVSAELAGCHPSCPIPVALLKVAEVTMEMALPKTVSIDFKKP